VLVDFGDAREGADVLGVSLARGYQGADVLRVGLGTVARSSLYVVV
jgi:hypothetical protein